MANSILGGTVQPNNSVLSPEMVQQFQQFKRSFQGNPKQQVMRMVQQGLRSNQQLQQAMSMAQQLQGFLK